MYVLDSLQFFIEYLKYITVTLVPFRRLVLINLQMEIDLTDAEEVEPKIGSNIQVEHSANEVKQLISLIMIAFRFTSLCF